MHYVPTSIRLLLYYFVVLYVMYTLISTVSGSGMNVIETELEL